MNILGLQVTWIEFFGVIFNLAGVGLTIKKSKYCFPIGIVGVGLYAVFYFREKLYADALLQLFYIFLLAYGWIQWRKASSNEEFIVTLTSRKLWITLAVLCLSASLVIGTVFMKYTDASLPFLDSMLTSMSLVAQWLVAKKKLENWLVWIVADIIYVGMFIFKHAYPTAILYFIFIILAVSGYIEWKKKLLTIERAN